ncbi:MAG TPA: sensor histidine kinase [Xanthomonadaceae bacterium]|jgi:signal transduction histidine kinase
MLIRLTHTQLLRYAGLFTWAMVGFPLLYLWYQSTPGLSDQSIETEPMGWYGWSCYAAFGLSYAWLTRSLGARRTGFADLPLLLLLTASAIGVSYYSRTGLGSVLQMVAAVVLPWLLPVLPGVAWLILSQLAVMPTFILLLHLPPIEALMQSLLYAGFSSFLFVTSLVARQQAQAREEQRRLNNELRATRALLAESTRLSERMRISRELHDLLGHHLTALSLNLEVAGHLSEGKVQEHVRQAHTLAKLLLTDVREAVSQLREDGAVDMSTALRTLTEGVLAPEIHLEMPEPFLVDDPDHANILLRCAQEIITNAVRHAQANNLWLSFRRSGENVEVSARDDGRGADHPALGNGLRGMRERLVQHAGSVDIATARGQGFALTLTLPMDKPT